MSGTNAAGHSWSFAPGQGLLTIDNRVPGLAADDYTHWAFGTLTFQYGLRPADVEMVRRGNDLVLLPIGDGGTVPDLSDPATSAVVIRDAFLGGMQTNALMTFHYADGASQRTAAYFFGELTALFPDGYAGPIPMSPIQVIRDPGPHTEHGDMRGIVAGADDVGLTLTGNTDSVALTGARVALTVTGDGATVRSNGNNDGAAVRLAGNGDRVVLAGTGLALALVGNAASVRVNGVGDSVSVAGSGNAVAVSGYARA